MFCPLWGGGGGGKFYYIGPLGPSFKKNFDRKLSSQSDWNKTKFWTEVQSTFNIIWPTHLAHPDGRVAPSHQD